MGEVDETRREVYKPYISISYLKRHHRQFFLRSFRLSCYIPPSLLLCDCVYYKCPYHEKTGQVSFLISYVYFSVKKNTFNLAVILLKSIVASSIKRHLRRNYLNLSNRYNTFFCTLYKTLKILWMFIHLPTPTPTYTLKSHTSIIFLFLF
jgi:hypothetical protein